MPAVTCALIYLWGVYAGCFRFVYELHNTKENIVNLFVETFLASTSCGRTSQTCKLDSDGLGDTTGVSIALLSVPLCTPINFPVVKPLLLLLYVIQLRTHVGHKG